MLCQRVQLDSGNSHVYMEAYIANPLGDYVRDAILVIPGGGYGICCSDREGEPVAQAFMPYGFNAFVLHYSNATNSENVFPTQLIEASKAMQHIRKNADRYHINPDRVFVCGFSAGGHLAACLGAMWHHKLITSEIGEGINRPNGMVLVYPVISADYHISSFYNLLGTKTPTQQQLKMCSIENHVDDRSVPAFVVHSFNDELVDVRNSLALASAYKAADRIMELHIYPDAPHGFALGNAITSCNNPKWNNPSIAKWVEQAVSWMKCLP